MTTPGEQQVLVSVSDSLAREFAGTFSRETVASCVSDSYARLAATAKVTNFLVPLAERFARERLQAAAQVAGSGSKGVPEVLFVCVHNAGRSQMAAALLERHGMGRVHVRSAGSEPVSRLNPAVVEAMRELGLDISREFPKPLTDEVVRAADVVITMGCGDSCPVFPGKRYLDWELEDPESKSLPAVRTIRDDIERRVITLLAELVRQPAM